MQVLIVDSFLDKVKTAPWSKALRDVIREELHCTLEVVPYSHFTPNYVEKYGGKFDAVVLSGSDAYLSKAEDRHAFKNPIDAVRMVTTPVLGICGGHQLIAVSYGQKIVNMGHTIDAYREVQVVADDPIFEGLPERIIVRQSHTEMVEQVPEGYSKMATSPETPIEAMKRNQKDITYGVQFHPEVHDKDHPDGKRIVSNFAKITTR